MQVSVQSAADKPEQKSVQYTIIQSVNNYIRQVNAVNGGDIVMLDSVRRSVTSL